MSRTNVKRVVFYISGHGLGHAVRTIEVMHALGQADPSVKVFIRTTAPRWIFDFRIQERQFDHTVRLDVGAVQNTSFKIDKKKTYDALKRIEKQWEVIFVREKTFLEKEKIHLVFGDIPHLAFRIASKVGLPSIAMSNFGWDWIYTPWSEELPEFRTVAERIQQDYSQASLLLRLPAHEPMRGFRTREDIPLIARKSPKDRSTLRRNLHVGTNQKVVLIALPERDRNVIPWKLLEKMEGMLFLSPFEGKRGKTIRPFSRMGVYFPDLVLASDAVLTKPGYSIVSECYANRAPILYVLRDDFRECALLTQWINRNMACELLSREDFEAGRWEEAIDRLLNKESRWSSLPTDGAKVAARRIVQFLE